jgi:hypothetical protein
MAVFEKIYRIASGDLRIKLIYASEDPFYTLNFENVALTELVNGFEDESETVFYPGSTTLSFTDYKRKNRDVLKYSFARSPQMHYSLAHSGQLWLNGVPIFDGYIDKDSLRYEEGNRHVTFDLIDKSIELKQLPFGYNLPEDWAGGIRDIYEQFRRIYPSLQFNVTNDVNVFSQSNFNGIFFRHNWRFRGNPPNPPGTDPVIIRSWNMNEDPEGFKNVSIFRKHLTAQAETCAGYIKNYADEFFMEIGSPSYNKLSISKRYINPGSVVVRDITGRIIEGSYYEESFIRNVRGVRNIPLYDEGSVVYTSGYQLQNPADPLGSPPANSDDDYDIRSILKTTVTESGSEGAATFRVSKTGQDPQEVLNGIFDPDADTVWKPIHQIITDLTFKKRRIPRSRFEIEVKGTGYFMGEYYKIQREDLPPVYLKPMEIKRNLTTKKSVLNCVEFWSHVHSG